MAISRTAATVAVTIVGTCLLALALRAEEPGAYRLKLDAGTTGSTAEEKPPLVKDEGLKVVEISEPAALAQSDTKYVLTKDVTAPGTAFTISRGVKNCILDLGGHTVVYNAEPRKEDPAKPYGHCVYGVSIAGPLSENIVVRNGTILQGAGGSSGCHAIVAGGGRAIEIYGILSRVYGASSSNVSVVWGGPDGRIHDNYFENRGRDIAPGLFSPDGISVSQSGPNWEIWNNTVIGGHTSISVGANAVKEQHTKYSIHHNFLSPRRIHGVKTPEGICTFGAAENYIYENEIATDDARGINIQARGSGFSDVHHNRVACRYSTEAKEGNYVENRCYGYWERDGEANKLHDNVWIVNNDVVGDRTSDSIGIVATTTGGRLKSAEFVNNRILCRHKDPKVDVLGFDVKRSDAGVIVRGNEIVARTAGIRLFEGCVGVQVKDNVFLTLPGTPAGAKAVDGDDVAKCVVEGNVTAALLLGDKPPAKPSGLVALLRPEAVELRWTHNIEKDVVGYNVYCDGRKINPYPVGGRFFVHVGVKPGEKHAYAVAALDLLDRESGRSDPLDVVQK